jgi:predicted amidohydrolase
MVARPETEETGKRPVDDLNLQEVFEHGRDAGRGNLVGIQPFMRQADYCSQAAFTERVRAYLRRAGELGWIGERTIAVLPEHLGTWLVTADERPAVYAATTVAQAMRPLALRHLGPFLVALLRAPEKDRAAAALFRVKAPRTAALYSAAFSGLAREFAVTIVAGSVVLPDPAVVDGKVKAGKGALYNTSFVFRPDGLADARLSRKVAPIDDELPFTTPARLEDLPVFETPAGKLGVLVCADSWYPEVYQRLKTQRVELVAVPSASSHGEIWEKPWGGYNGRAAPADVNPGDVGRLTEREAWGRYALAARMGSAGARAGINVFLYGDLWDLEFTGGRWRIVCGDTDLEGCCYGPALINLWL